MKLFNAQSANKDVKTTKNSTNSSMNLSKNIVIDKSLLEAVAGGINDGKIVWPVVRPK